MRIAIANEPSALGRLEDGGLEHPEVLLRTAKPEGWLHVDASTVVLHRQSQQVGMGDVSLRLSWLFPFVDLAPSRCYAGHMRPH